MNSARRAASPAVRSWVYILRIYYIVTRIAEKEIRDEGLTLPRFDVIAQLGSMESCCTQDSLCDRLLVTKGNVSSLIHRMVQEGLVAREEDSANRRRNRIELTTKGRAVFRKVVPAHERCLNELFSPLTRSEQAELKDLLFKLLRGIREQAQCGGCDESDEE